MAVDVGSAVGYLDLDISGFLKNLNSAQSEADKTTKNMATKIGNNLSSAGKKLTSVGTTLTKNVTVPLLGIGAAAIKVASDFDKGMSEVKAISGATGKEFEALREKAIELGADTAFSASEVAEAMTEMAKAGWNSQQIIDGMSGVLAAAAASGEGLASVSTIVADAITGFGLAAKDSTRVADLLTQAANSGTIGIADLGESFKYIAPVAGSMGLSIEDVTTALSAMSMAGIKGSQAGTALRTILTNMVKPTKDVAVAMHNLGVSATNSDGSMKSLDEIVASLRIGFDKLTESEKAQYAAVIAGKEGMSGLLSLLNLTEQEYNEIAASMDNANGIAEQTAAIMQDNLKSEVEQLGGALESLAIKLSDLVIPYLREFVKNLTLLIDKLVALEPESQKAILSIGGIAMAAGPAITMVGKLTSGAGSLFTALGKIGTGFTAVKTGGTAAAGILSKLGGFLATTPGIVTLVVAAIAALAAGFIYLWNNCEGFRNFFIDLWEKIKVAFQAFLDFILPIINSSIETIKNFFVGLWEKIKEIWGVISQSLKPLVDEIVGAFKMAWDVIVLVWDYAKPFFMAIWENIKAVFSVVTKILGGFFSAAWEAIKAVWNVAVSWFKLIWENIKAIFSVVGTVLSGFFKVAWEAIKAIWNGVIAFFTLVWAGIKAVFAVVKGVLSGNFSDAWEAIKNVWDKVKNYFGTVWTGIKNVFSSVVDFFKNSFSSAWEAIKKVFSNFGSFFGSLWDIIKNTFVNLGTKIGSAIGNAVKAGINGVIGIIENTINGFIGLINGAINLINLIPGVELGKIGRLNFPRLAKGAVLPPNNPFLAVVGDQKSGVNVEAPLSTIQEAVALVIDGFAKEIIALQRAAVDVLVDSRNELGYIARSGFGKNNNANKTNSVKQESPGGGDTFVFHSPKPIDEIEAAKQIKKTKRELAEGF